MSINIAGWGRALRIVLGLMLIALVFVGPKTALGWIGAVPLLTGLAGYCPLYSWLGVSTRRSRRRGPAEAGPRRQTTEPTPD
jgi:hypothetical protein